MENVKLSPAQKFWKTVKSNPIVVLLVVVGIIVGFTKDNFSPGETSATSPATLQSAS